MWKEGEPGDEAKFMYIIYGTVSYSQCLVCALIVSILLSPSCTS